MFAVVKEIEAPVEDEVPAEKMLGLTSFEDEYFCGPLYHDPERVFWNALGNEPLISLGGLFKLVLNPFKLRASMKEMGERQAAKGVEGNMVGDGLTKGGILVIDRNDVVRHVFYEDPGKGVPPEDMALILSAAKEVAEEVKGVVAPTGAAAAVEL